MVKQLGAGSMQHAVHACGKFAQAGGATAHGAKSLHKQVGQVITGQADGEHAACSAQACPRKSSAYARALTA